MFRASLQMNELRVVFFGMTGRFSQPPLLALLDAGIQVTAVFLPAENAPQPVRQLAPAATLPALQLTPTRPTIADIAWQRHIPVYEISRLSAPETRQLIASLTPDAACVACFNKRIPADLLALPRHGFLNVHPSLLPHFRGPAPLFWTFRAGVQKTGVTVHFMDAGLDTGDIAAQAPLTLPDGISGLEADEKTAVLGGQLLVETLTRLANGTLTRTTQPPGGSAQPWPQAADFRIPASWSLRRAYNFMRGTAVFGQPFVVEMEDREEMWVTAV
jgi:methionyl-tRNA formyltransferase